ncbi:MAG TPA: CHRD domain-containing protein [Vicinamibacterales bacterium]|nr:CHRD domain-containing protein [Vicinamibacterales bacterium]
MSVRPSEIVLPLNFSTHMQGHHEVPARPSTAQGQVILKISDDRQSIEYKLIASNIYNVVASHIHQGEVGVAGPAVVFLYGNAAPGGGRHDGVLSTGTLTAASLVGPLAGRPFSELIDLIQSGNAYANVHTNDGVGALNTGPGDFQAGEIRGQLRK